MSTGYGPGYLFWGCALHARPAPGEMASLKTWGTLNRAPPDTGSLPRREASAPARTRRALGLVLLPHAASPTDRAFPQP